MCDLCGKAHRENGPTSQNRRSLLFGGATLIAATPALLAGEARAEQPRPAAGDGPYPTRAWATAALGGPFAPITIQRRALGPNDVLLDVLYAGICHSDVHTVRGDWGTPPFPCVPGHEIVGRVAAVGSAVTKFKAGDLGGVGCMVKACGTCANCLADREQICLDRVTFTYGSEDDISGGHTYGGYSDRMVVREKFVIRIPPGMDPVSTAPILCAGITTFSPLRHWAVRPGQRVGVVGLGGLGHMAVKLAVAQRADVTVFTTTPGKLDDAKRLGAGAAVLWDDKAAMARLANAFDLIISTVPYAFEAQPFMDMLKLDCTLVNVGLGEARGLDPAAMAFGRKGLAGSMIGGIAETQEVVDHCFARGIRPDVEVIRPDQIAAAYDRVVGKDVRYRFVIDFASAR
ncbi:NAD(P)-dependent alcohol dehydrogenase [Zavarzinia compransoris]|uniref:Hydroxyacid dehydrogenase n=1 Tax=Zavarzinia compransoris TaxID=1264899 RepID=A0A317EA01_9PROT|nr:NAD(P)-dependent alcohol dehydrogenase [Zavarzinia compransoris]PWR23076.1 hydroxyacid dehydrogenase [Zavarzinia compransoris]TDP46376.1 putative zinc-type alcohol dehydrogenase-like protein [Zavarzinia compransoris]